MEGERLTISETLAAPPGYRQAAGSAREFLLCSRQKETERREAEERQRKAELEAAQEKQRAAQEREELPRRNRLRRKRSLRRAAGRHALRPQALGLR